MTELEKIDLELFKACYPKCKIHYAEWDDGHKYPEFIPSGKPLRTHAIDLRPVPQFTKDIGVCFAILIPEMNRRGFDFDVYVYVSGSGYAEFWKGYEKSSVDFHNRNELPAAISKAAYAALKGEKC